MSIIQATIKISKKSKYDDYDYNTMLCTSCFMMHCYVYYSIITKIMSQKFVAYGQLFHPHGVIVDKIMECMLLCRVIGVQTVGTILL